jgi:GWxTD domain-containing protein
MIGGLIQFLVLLSLADSLFTYAQWDQTPEAYFLTESEGVAWKEIANDEEAAAFICTYYGRRGISFREELERRIALADKLFSRPDVEGSSTLSGRILIVLGEPEQLHLHGLWRNEITGQQDFLLYSNATPFGGGLPKKTSSYRRTFVYDLHKKKRVMFEVQFEYGRPREEMRKISQRVLFEMIARDRAEDSIRK